MKKFIILILMTLTSIVNAQIAANTDWTFIGRTKEVPNTVTIPSVAKDQAAELYYINLEYDATTYDNNTQATAFTALGNAVQASVTPTYLATTMGLDTSDIASVRLAIMSIQRGWDNISLREKVNILKQAEDIFLLRVRVEVSRE